MWNLFSVTEPKVQKPSKNLKQEMLQQEAKSLKQIQNQAQKILNTINSLLKRSMSDSEDEEILQSNEELNQLEQMMISLHQNVIRDNKKFELAISGRDTEKSNHQQFFKQTMKSYQIKKTELNNYIEQLEDKVQKLQQLGYKTYDLNPAPNNVLSGINKNYIQKILSKIDEKKKIKTQMLSRAGVLSRSKKSIDENQRIQINFNSKQLDFVNRCNSLNDIQKELEMILLKEQLIEEMLNKKILENKKKFLKMAAQQKALKQAIRKGNSTQQKKRCSKRLSQGLQPQLQKLKKKSSTLQSSSQANGEPLSIQQTEQAYPGVNCLEGQDDNELSSSDKESVDDEFLQGCEYLITERFLENQNEEKEKNLQILNDINFEKDQLVEA